MTTPTSHSKIVLEAANQLEAAFHCGPRDVSRFADIIQSAIEKAMSGQRIYGEWGTAVVIPDEAAQPQRSEWAKRVTEANGVAGTSDKPPATDDQQIENLARDLHDIYERLAPDFDYETRKETREFDPQSPNGRLMIAVCRELQFRALRNAALAAKREPCDFEKREPFAHDAKTD